MNTIRSYKALTIVSNVEQGEMVKRLIKENKELQRLKEITEKCVPGMIEIYRFLKEMQYISDAPLNGIDDGSGDFDDYIQYSKFIATIENLLASDTL